MSGIFDFLQALGQLGTSMQPATPAAGAAPGAVDPALAQLAQSLGVDPNVLATATTPAGAKTADTPMVWLGQRYTPKPNPRIADTDGFREQYKTNMAKVNGAAGRIAVTSDAAANLPFTWNEKERDAAYARVSDAVGQPIQSFQQFNTIWANAVKTAQQSWTATDGGKKGSPLTVWDVFDLAKREGSKYGFTSGGSGGGGGGGGSRTTVSTSSSVEKLSDGEMWQVLKSSATNILGRAPTNDELQRFASRANQVASSNPTKSRSVTTSSAGGSSTHTTTKHGASAADYQLEAENMANSTPEAGAVQSATTYANALFQGLSSPV